MLGRFIFCFSGYFCYEFWLVFKEECVEVIILISGSLFGEAVHVELSYVGVHVVVFEVDG